MVEAAIREFAERGYEAASTAAIAERAGISQPYIYALFPSKRDLFLAAYDRVQGRIRATFREAARGARSPEEALGKMGMTYPELIADRYELLMQLQAYAASADPEIHAHCARRLPGPRRRRPPAERRDASARSRSSSPPGCSPT